MEVVKEIIDWLLGIEETAHRVYEKAASKFKDDKKFADFLRQLSEEEKEHYYIISKASELIKDRNNLPSPVSLSKNMKQEIENYFLLTEKRMEAGKLTKENLIDCIVSSEYSEWNSLFLYVVNTLKHNHREFIPSAVKIQQHKKSIERFLEKIPGFNKHLERIRNLSEIWQENFLVVDDEYAIVELVNAVLEDEGRVESAANGEEALRKVSERYFAAIVTDIEMPVMNGIEFYNKAVESYPNIKERFLFFTATDDAEDITLLKKNNLRYLKKPSPIGDIKKEVVDILSR